MFKVALKNTVTFPVKLKFSEGSETKQFAFSLTATRVDSDRIKAEMEDADKPISDFMSDVITGWSGQRLILNPDDTPADFSKEALDAMFQVAGTPFTIYQAYQKAIAPAKN